MTLTEARELAARLRDLDIEEGEGGDALRELQRQLEAQAAQNDSTVPDALWRALSNAMVEACKALESAQSARAIDRMRLAEAMRAAARDAVRAAQFQDASRQLAVQIEALRGDLRMQGEQLATVRAQSLLRESAVREEISRRDALIEQERGKSAALETTLEEAGHRLVTRVGELAARHPAIAAALRAPVRVLSRLLHPRKP